MRKNDFSENPTNHQLMEDVVSIGGSAKLGIGLGPTPEVIGGVNAPPVSPAAAILAEAARIIDGERQAVHGQRERSFQAIARHWNLYLTSRKQPDDAISEVDVCVMMALLKVVRSVSGQKARDHYLDAAGYLALAGELAQREMKS